MNSDGLPPQSSLYMRPPAPFSDQVDQCNANAVAFSYRRNIPAGPIFGPDRADIVISKFGGAVGLSAHITKHDLAPTFGVHVAGVVEGRANKKVAWVAADWVVARVANKQAIADGACRKLISKTVNVLPLTGERKRSVSAGLSVARPRPARLRAGLRDPSPKSARQVAISLRDIIGLELHFASSAGYTSHLP